MRWTYAAVIVSLSYAIGVENTVACGGSHADLRWTDAPFMMMIIAMVIIARSITFWEAEDPSARS